MTTKQWAIIGILLTTTVIVFCLLFFLVTSLLQSSPTPSTARLVVKTETPVPTSVPLPTLTRQLIVQPTPTPISNPTKTDVIAFLKEQKCTTYTALNYVVCLVVFYNPTDSVVGSVGVNFDFFDNNGVSLGSEVGVADNLFPKETRKQVVHFRLPDKVKLGRYNFKEYLASALGKGSDLRQNPFAVSNVGIKDSTVTAIISNSSTKTFDSVEVDVVLFNKKGEFTGGGHKFAPLLPAGGKARVEVSILFSFGEAAKIEVYPSIGGITSME